MKHWLAGAFDEYTRLTTPASAAAPRMSFDAASLRLLRNAEAAYEGGLYKVALGSYTTI